MPHLRALVADEGVQSRNQEGRKLPSVPWLLLGLAPSLCLAKPDNRTILEGEWWGLQEIAEILAIWAPQIRLAPQVS